MSLAITEAIKNTSGPSDFASLAALAVGQHVTFDPAKAKDVLGDIYNQAGDLGAKTAAEQLGTDVVTPKSITDLLAQRDITLKGIGDSSLQRISDTIAQGLSNNAGQSSISDSVNAVIFDPRRADVITTTESNRAMNSAYVDQLQSAGETKFDWINDADPCDECQAELGTHDIGDPVPPEHPSCRCVAVMANGDTAS